MPRRLIVNADDFGLTPGVNRGIAHCFQHGIVTSTTLMVNMPGFAHAAWLADHLPGLAVGLHLNLTYGRPLLPSEQVGSLVNEAGAFVKDPRFVLARGRPDEVLAEFWAQARRFRTTGLPLSHLDTHHHLHREPRLLEQVATVARALGVPVRCLDPAAMAGQGLACRARFTSFFGDQEGVARLLAIVAALPEGVTEIPCHPGFVDDELKAASTLNEVRGRELAALTDPRVAQALQSNGVELTNYPRLGRDG